MDRGMDSQFDVLFRMYGRTARFGSIPHKHLAEHTYTPSSE